MRFDRLPIMRDVNITYPIDRLRDLVARGEVGGLAPNGYSFMGAQRELTRIEGETGPDVARQLREDGAEVAFITPT
jgi:D-proline reductase (dithiol) PrdB